MTATPKSLVFTIEDSRPIRRAGLQVFSMVFIEDIALICVNDGACGLRIGSGSLAILAAMRRAFWRQAPSSHGDVL